MVFHFTRNAYTGATLQSVQVNPIPSFYRKRSFQVQIRSHSRIRHPKCEWYIDSPRSRQSKESGTRSFYYCILAVFHYSTLSCRYSLNVSHFFKFVSKKPNVSTFEVDHRTLLRQSGMPSTKSTPNSTGMLLRISRISLCSF